MSKKTVLKKCLKYAPLKTEFVRGIATDETIKTSIADNMTEIADETDYTEIEAEATPAIPQNVDTETGEILSLEGKQEPAPAEALFQSADEKVADPEHTEAAQAEYPGKRPGESALEYDRRMVRYCLKVVGADIGDYVKFGRQEVPLVIDGHSVYDKNTGKQVMETINYVELNDSSANDTGVIDEVRQGKAGISIKLADKKWAWF